jgi:hypothetical protein
MLCPVCRATNDSGPACRRCKADLSLLFELESQRSAYLVQTQARLGDEAACAAARRADDLRHGDDARRLLALACLLRGEHAAAWQAYHSVKTD